MTEPQEIIYEIQISELEKTTNGLQSDVAEPQEKNYELQILEFVKKTNRLQADVAELRLRKNEQKHFFYLFYFDGIK
jgi:hypothetical protein